MKPEEFYRYHRALYAGRGVIDGQRALSTASTFKLDQQKILDAANDDGITDIMKAPCSLRRVPVGDGRRTPSLS
jgi:hypothetical protein